MIQISNLSLYFGEKTIFDQLSLNIKPSDKIGLIGRNGAGKTSLLKLIVKEISPDGGKIDYPDSLKIAYLKQFINQVEDGSILQETLAGYKDTKLLHMELMDIQSRIEGYEGSYDETYSQLLTQMSDLTEQESAAVAVKARAERILKGLGFKQEQLKEKILTLSGGWQMRVELAKILLGDPDYLLLDEPTNYLDIESIIWFESYLRNYSGAIIIISHDETFLDNCTNSTIEITNGKVFTYPYPYTKALSYRDEREKIHTAAYENQQRVIAQKQRTIDRFRAKASKSKMAKSMEKQLGKMKKIEPETLLGRDLKLKFNDPPRSGDLVLEVKDLQKKYDANTVFENINFELRRGEKIALVGKNGAGKSTLIQLITNRIDPTAGAVKLGHNVKIGVYYQDQADGLDEDITVYETLELTAPFELRPKLRGILGAFLFSGDDIDKKVKVLSGGERSRLAIAALLLEPYNFLILDEPTNHLDVFSKNKLKEALQAYPGTLITVSHDRKFLRDLTEKTIELRDRSLHTYLGGIDYFLEKLSAQSFRDFELGEKSEEGNKLENEKSKNQQQKSKRERIKKLRRQIQYMERDIHKMELNLVKLEKEMASEQFYKSSDAKEKLQIHTHLKKRLQNKHEEWDVLVEELMTLED